MALLGGILDTLFLPFTSFLSPRWSLVVISLVITFLMTLAYKYLTNQTLMKQLKDEVKTLQEEMKANKDSKEKMAELQKKAMTKNLEVMKHGMRPTLFTFIPIIIIFSWLRETYLPAGDLFSWGIALPFLGKGIGWLWTYILSSIVFSSLLRKALKVY